MNWGAGFVELDKELHERSTFDCGEEELNEFIRTRAARHMAAGLSKTLVLPTDAPALDGKYGICAFFTLTPQVVERESLPADLAKKLPHYPVPVFLIAQLAVHLELKGRNLGRITLFKALDYLWHVNSRMPAYAVVVDCLNQRAQGFYEKFGFQVLGEHHGRVRMFLPMRTVEELMTEA